MYYLPLSFNEVEHVARVIGCCCHKVARMAKKSRETKAPVVFWDNKNRWKIERNTQGITFALVL
jgi:hypothetical protein